MSKRNKQSKLNKNKYRTVNARYTKNAKHTKNTKNVKYKYNGLSIITDGITPRNERFEKICLMRQNRLKIFLRDEMKETGKEVIEDNGFLFVQGSLPILLVAHMDTVHKDLPTEIIYANGTISSQQGIGADDRAGIYMILEILKQHDCSVLFCEDEESGCIGSGKFCKSKLAKELTGKFNYLIEIDRMNGNDAVFYECDNPEFEEFITKEHWKTAIGSYTDIVELSPVLEAASVNFSCGYYKQHTKDEYLVLDEMETNIKEICKLIDRTDMEKDKYEYIDACSYSRWLLGHEDYSTTIGTGNYAYYIAYFDESRFDAVEEILANSIEEAVGIFLMNHTNMSYSDLLGAMTEDEYYEYCKLYM